MSDDDRRIVSCPACGRRFRLPAAGGPRPGQKLRCGACGHVFAHPARASQASRAAAGVRPPREEEHAGAASADEKAVPAAGDAAAAEREASEQSDNHAQATADAADAVLRALRARNEAQRKPRAPLAAGRARMAAVAAGWLAWIGFVAGLVWLVLWGPESWRAAVPGLARAHALIAGAEEKAPALVITLSDRGRWEETPDGWRLVVEGVVRNPGARERVVPPVIVLLKDGTGRVLAKAIAEGKSARVPPHGSVAFTARFERVRLDGADTGGLAVTAEFARIAPRGGPAAAHGGEDGHGPHSRR